MIYLHFLVSSFLFPACLPYVCVGVLCSLLPVFSLYFYLIKNIKSTKKFECVWMYTDFKAWRNNYSQPLSGKSMSMPYHYRDCWC